MNRIPFSAYDFFGYLASGFLFLAAVDYAAGGNWLLREDLGVVFGLFWVGGAYIVGQILASPSAWLLERTIVGKCLLRPNINLFKDSSEKRWASLFPGYFTPLPPEIRRNIIAKAKIDGIYDPGEALLLIAFGKIKSDGNAMARLNTFLNLYGFCRNICFTCLLAALVILTGIICTGTWNKLIWVFISLGGSGGMFYRYLKFFRQYSYDLFVSYAALPDRRSKHGS